jgi:hypothetical protein
MVLAGIHNHPRSLLLRWYCQQSGGQTRGAGTGSLCTIAAGHLPGPECNALSVGHNSHLPLSASPSPALNIQSYNNCNFEVLALIAS